MNESVASFPSFDEKDMKFLTEVSEDQDLSRILENITKKDEQKDEFTLKCKKIPKSNEKSSLNSPKNPENTLVFIIEDLISYFQIEENIDMDFSFSNEKYEYAINIIKQREDQRKILIQANEEMKKTLKENFETIKTLEKKILDNEKKTKNFEEIMKKKKFISSESKNSGFEKNFPFLCKITENNQQNDDKSIINLNYSCEILNSCDRRLNNSIEHLKFSNLKENEYIVTKPVAVYINKLLNKISILSSKNKKLRLERNIALFNKKCKD